MHKKLSSGLKSERTYDIIWCVKSNVRSVFFGVRRIVLKIITKVIVGYLGIKSSDFVT